MELSKVKFMVDEKNRVVTATIRDISSDAIKTFNKKFVIHAGNDFNLSIDSDKYQKFMMPDYLKVVVHCHPDDTFDEKIGKRIRKSSPILLTVSFSERVRSLVKN